MKTTAAQFNYFQGRVAKWAQHYGLHHIRIATALQGNPDNDEEAYDDCLAWAHYDPESSLAIIGLNPELGKEDGSQKSLDRAALHEVWEVIAWPVRDMLLNRGYSFEQVNTVIHDIIRRTETAQLGF